MSRDAVKAGKALAESKREETRLAENISPDDPSAVAVIGVSERVRLVRQRITIKGLVVDSGALVFDRPQEGQMFDNSAKSFDVGYDESQSVVLFEEVR